MSLQYEACFSGLRAEMEPCVPSLTVIEKAGGSTQFTAGLERHAVLSTILQWLRENKESQSLIHNFLSPQALENSSGYSSLGSE